MRTQGFHTKGNRIIFFTCDPVTGLKRPSKKIRASDSVVGRQKGKHGGRIMTEGQGRGQDRARGRVPADRFTDDPGAARQLPRERGMFTRSNDEYAAGRNEWL